MGYKGIGLLASFHMNKLMLIIPPLVLIMGVVYFCAFYFLSFGLLFSVGFFLLFLLYLLLLIPYFYWLAPYRKILVYKDRIDVIFPFERRLNYSVNMKRVKSYFVEEREIIRGNSVGYSSRVFLLENNRLWLYVYMASNSSELEEAIALLDNHFHLIRRDVGLQLSAKESRLRGRLRYLEYNES